MQKKLLFLVDTQYKPCYLRAMERNKTTVKIDGKRTITMKLPIDFVDRMIAEGVTDLDVNIDDEKGILVIRPKE